MKLIKLILKIVLFAIVLVIGILFIYDQFAIMDGKWDIFPSQNLSELGILEGLGIKGAFNNLNNDTKRLGYYLIFFGAIGMFIFILLAWVLKTIPVLGKIMLWFLGIIPTISVLIIIIGILMITGMIPDFLPKDTIPPAPAAKILEIRAI